MTDAEIEISNYKYHSARVVALSDGTLAVIGHHSNSHGLPLIDIATSFEHLHALLWDFQRKPWTMKHDHEPTKPQVQLSLEDLGMLKPLKRRSLHEQTNA